jgi:preprotein translocase SecE subunit
MNPQAIWSELRAYPRGVVEEMQKVSWPTRKTTRTLTGIVVAVVAVSALIISGLDLVFSRIMAFVLGL